MGPGRPGPSSVEVMMAPDYLKSILESILDSLKNMSDLREAKDFAVNEIKNHRIDETAKRKLLFNIGQQTSMYSLLKLLYNSLLKYEGMSVNQ